MGENTDMTVGVLGGLGPDATLDFMAKLLARTTALTGASTDQEHLHLLVDCNPKVANRNRAVAGTGPSPAPDLAAMAQRLSDAGADLLVMACNTAHHWEADIRAATDRPFLSILDATLEALRQQAPTARTIGVLATEGTRAARLYETALERAGYRPVGFDDAAQDRFMALLYRIKAGERGTDIRAAMRTLAEGLAEHGADAILAGCTEVPLVLGPEDISLPFIDSSLALADLTVRIAKRLQPLPAFTNNKKTTGTAA
jgi:aspartate racemase